eukprot:4869362-Prymnesium_polylepis.1
MAAAASLSNMAGDPRLARAAGGRLRLAAASHRPKARPTAPPSLLLLRLRRLLLLRRRCAVARALPRDPGDHNLRP